MGVGLRETSAAVWCIAVVACLAAFAGGIAQAQGGSAVIDTEHGLPCNHAGGVWDGTQCRFPGASSPATRSPGGNSGQQNYNRALGNLGNALGAFGAMQEQQDQDRENAAEQQRQEQAARDAAEAQRRAAEAAADARRRAALSNPFNAGQQASTNDNPFNGGQQASSNGNPFAATLGAPPTVDVQDCGSIAAAIAYDGQQIKKLADVSSPQGNFEASRASLRVLQQLRCNGRSSGPSTVGAAAK